MEDIAADLIQDWLDEQNISQENVSNRNHDLVATTFLTMLDNDIRPSDTDIHKVAHAISIEAELLHYLCEKLFNDTPTTDTNKA